MTEGSNMEALASMMAEKFQAAMLSILDENRKMRAELRQELRDEKAALLTEIRTNATGAGALTVGQHGPTIDALESTISEFVYDPDDDIIFDSWYARYRELFEEEASTLPDKAKVRMLMRHVSLPVAERYRDYIAPAEATSISFEDTVKTMSSLFGKTISVFERRLQIIHLKMSQMDTDDVRVLACEINKLFTRAALKTIDPEELRTTLFLAAMDSPRLTDTRLRLLKIVSTNPKITLNELVEECGKLAALKRDSVAVAVTTTQSINVVTHKQMRPQSKGSDGCLKSKRHHSFAKDKKSRDMSSVQCHYCGKYGHIEKFCKKEHKSDALRQEHAQCNAISQTVYATVTMDGRAVELQVDSGSDWTMISMEMWERLGRPALQPVHEMPKCANDQELMIQGMFHCTLEYKGKRGFGAVYVNTKRCLLGLDWFYILEAHRAFSANHDTDVYHQFVTGPQDVYCDQIRRKDLPELCTPGSGRGTKNETPPFLRKDAKPVQRSAKDMRMAKKTSNDAEICQVISNHPTDDEDTVTASVDVEDDVCHSIRELVRVLPIVFSDIQKESGKDPVLQDLIKYHRTSWPKSIPQVTLPYYRQKDSLSVYKGCVLVGARIVIPRTLQSSVLRELHRGHPGMERTKSVARLHVYWPKIDEDIQNVVSRCKGCSITAKQPRKVPSKPWSSTSRPMERVYVDYAVPVNHKYYLVIVDAHSKWPEVIIADHITAKVTRRIMEDYIARYGAPETIVSDNRTQFVSADFKEMCESFGIEHIRSPAYHPQSNGQAERFVDTLKRTLLKLKGEAPERECIETFLMTYRSTPNKQINGMTPAQIFLGRQIRSRLDLMKERPRSPSVTSPVAKHIKDQFDMKHGAKAREYQANDLVYYRKHLKNDEMWCPATVLRKIGHVIYEIALDDKTVRAHANQLLPRRDEDNVPIDVLLDTFSLDEEALPIAEPRPVCGQSPMNSPQKMPPRDRPKRNRVPVQRLNITSTRGKTYELRTSSFPIPLCSPSVYLIVGGVASHDATN